MSKPRPKDVAVKSSLGDYRDYQASRQYVTEGRLTEAELELLHGWFSQSADNRRIFHLWSGRLKLRHGQDEEMWAYVREVAESVWGEWLERVMDYEVEIKAAGRAVVRGPGDDYKVEIQWLFVGRSKQRRVKSVRVVADDFLSGHSMPSINEHLAAFQLRAAQRPTGAFSRMPRSQPAPGQAADPDFYKRLLNAYQNLISEGYKNPAVELAERMDVNHNTVKSWLKRGREYLKED
jgi:hypothetical protein